MVQESGRSANLKSFFEAGTYTSVREYLSEPRAAATKTDIVSMTAFCPCLRELSAEAAVPISTTQWLKLAKGGSSGQAPSNWRIYHGAIHDNASFCIAKRVEAAILWSAVDVSAMSSDLRLVLHSPAMRFEKNLEASQQYGAYSNQSYLYSRVNATCYM